MHNREWSVARYGALIAILFTIACVVYLITVGVLGIETEVMRDRFWKNAEPLFNGEVPIMEYPPFALVFIAIPRLFADTPFGYNVAYVVEVLAFMVAGLYLSMLLARRFEYSEKRAMLIYAVLILLMLEFVVDRYDIFPAIITLASFYALSTQRYGWAFALLAIGAMTKIYPALLFPAYLIWMLHGRRIREAVAGTAVFFFTGILLAAVAWLIDPDTILNFLEYHGDRPLQVESVASSFIYLLSMMGLTDVWIQPFADPMSFGSDNLRGFLPDAVATILMPILVVALLATYALHVVALRKRDDHDMTVIGLSIMTILMVFMVFNKVFSSQYLIWIIAPALFLMFGSSGQIFKRRLIISVIVMIAITQLNFAYNAGYMAGDIGDIGMLIILARNILAVAVACMCMVEMVRPSGVGKEQPKAACDAASDDTGWVFLHRCR